MEPTPTDNTLLDALRRRRSMVRVLAEPPPRDLVERLLEACTWAPNHYRTNPWRFAVVTGNAREKLGEIMATSLAARLEDAEDGEAPGVDKEALLHKERRKPLRAPVVIAVACEPSSAPKVTPVEEICAVAAGVQNMLLAAESLGLGAMWRTGNPARDPAVKSYLGFPQSAEIVAFLYVGYPDVPSQHDRVRDAKPYTRWLSDS